MIAQKSGTAKHVALTIAAAGVLLAGVYLFSTPRERRVLSVDPTRLTSATVTLGEFQEYYPFTATVEPETSVYLDVQEGGRVEEIAAEGGRPVNKGELILRISNAALQRTAIDTETRLLQNLDLVRNTQFDRAQSRLMLTDQLLDLDYRILELEKKHTRYLALKKVDGVLAEETFETVRDELDYRRRKRTLLQERIRQEELLNTQQLAQAEQSIARLERALELLGRIVDSLEVHAPISGHLSNINAQLGENIRPGQRIGQIDLLDAFKLRVAIDQYYINRVSVGSTGRCVLDGTTHDVEISKIYPEVEGNQFTADMRFTGALPEGIRRGQTLTVEMSFGATTRSLQVPKGGFYQSTGGRWVYLIAPDGDAAYRANVRLGRQNPKYVEVLEGLREGDRIVTSNYELYGDADELRFATPLAASP
ncbi:MAG: HlyD family efflux transporter periplasmic adaptor subunit [Gammaproteobacteria bacterium]|nr:HlyD family efflux transporter periplasmic adaptor subunit [Gammaproteobacteria bacterium]